MAEPQMIEQLEADQPMFVQTAHGATSDGGTLTLNEVAPSTLYFSDRPERIVGHLATADFVDLWGEGENNGYLLLASLRSASQHTVALDSAVFAISREGCSPSARSPSASTATTSGRSRAAGTTTTPAGARRPESGWGPGQRRSGSPGG